MRHAVVFLLATLAHACTPSSGGVSGQSSPTSRPASSATPNPLVTAPLPIPSSVLSASVGSGVPLDAPVSDEPANDATTFIPLARHNNTPADRALDEGDSAYRLGQFLGAQKAYEKAVGLAPKDPAPIVGVVRSRLSAENAPVDIAAAPKHPGLEAAVVDLEKAVRLDEKFVPARLELGRTFLVLGRMDEALAVLRRAIDLVPQHAEVHSTFGVALLASGMVEAGARELQIAAGMDANSAVRFQNMGTALFALGKPSEAVQAFERAVSFAPKDARIQNQLGTALLTEGQTDRALEHLQAAVKRDPKRATYRSNLGYAWAQKGEIERAIVIYREALTLDERLVSAWINLGNALAKQRKFREAHGAYDKALALDPTDPRVKAVIEELETIERSAGASDKPSR